MINVNASKLVWKTLKLFNTEQASSVFISECLSSIRHDMWKCCVLKASSVYITECIFPVRPGVWKCGVLHSKQAVCLFLSVFLQSDMACGNEVSYKQAVCLFLNVFFQSDMRCGKVVFQLGQQTQEELLFCMPVLFKLESMHLLMCTKWPNIQLNI